MPDCFALPSETGHSTEQRCEQHPLLGADFVPSQLPSQLDDGTRTELLCYDHGSHSEQAAEPVYGTFFNTNHFSPRRGSVCSDTPSVVIAAAGHGTEEEETHHVSLLEKSLVTVEKCSQTRAAFALVKQYIGIGKPWP